MHDKSPMFLKMRGVTFSALQPRRHHQIKSESHACMAPRRHGTAGHRRTCGVRPVPEMNELSSCRDSAGLVIGDSSREGKIAGSSHDPSNWSAGLLAFPCFSSRLVKYVD